MVPALFSWVASWAQVSEVPSIATQLAGKSNVSVPEMSIADW